MKNIKKITGCLLVILMAGSLNLSAQRGMRRSAQDSAFVRHDSLRMHMTGRPMHGNFDRRMPFMGPLAYGWNAPGMGPRTMNPWMAHGMRYGRGMQYSFGREMMPGGPGKRIMESIPGITEKQKEDLANLNEKQRSEMQSLMEKNREAVKKLREDHRQKVMNLLTDEQKKWLEENTPDSRNR